MCSITLRFPEGSLPQQCFAIEVCMHGARWPEESGHMNLWFSSAWRFLADWRKP